MVRFFTFLLFCNIVSVGNSQFTSLEELEKNCPNCSSSDLVDSLVAKAKQYTIEKIDSCFYFLERAENVILNAGDQIEEKKPVVWNAYIRSYSRLKQRNKVRFYLDQLLNFHIAEEDPENAVETYLRIANEYAAIPDYASAYESYQKGLEISKANNLTESTISILIGIGNIYAYQEKYEQAIQVYKEVVEKQAETEFQPSHLTVLNNIAACYGLLEDFDKSLAELKNVLNLSIENNDSASIALVYGNIGGLYVEMNELELAKKNLEKAIEINDALKRATHLTGNYLNLALVLKMNGEFGKAIENLEKVTRVSESLEDKVTLIEAYKELHQIYAETNQFKKAYAILVKYEALRQKIFNQQQADKIATIKAGYEIEKREKEIKIREKEIQIKGKEIEILKRKDELNEEQISKSRITTSALLIGVFLSLLIVFILIWSVRKKNQNNKLIQHKNYELAKKNDEIIDSINYAKRLQDAILPRMEAFQKYFKQSFVFYLPKDIVAGDFYFYDVVKDGTKKHVFFAAADCTGHGVPGAMVSIVGANGLKRCIQEFGILQPAAILDRVAQLVADHFSQSKEKIRDGMDIALCCIEFENETPVKIQFAGANNPLWIINPNRQEPPKGSRRFKQGDGFEIKGDKQAIGYTEDLKPFTNHEFNLDKGDTFYIFSDGFADQFGGPNGKKFKSLSFKKLLSEINAEDLPEQKRIIKKTFNDWKNTQDQVDDVCVIGVRL